jgi:hypothetical protein
MILTAWLLVALAAVASLITPFLTALLTTLTAGRLVASRAASWCLLRFAVLRTTTPLSNSLTPFSIVYHFFPPFVRFKFDLMMGLNRPLPEC